MKLSTSGVRQFEQIRVVEEINGKAALEIRDPLYPESRYTLWHGLPPNSPPGHPALAKQAHTGRMFGEAVWIEERPAGVTLEELMLGNSALDSLQKAIILCDCCDAVQVLHLQGLAHGDLRPNRIVIDSEGQAVLIGVGTRDGHSSDDLVALLKIWEKLGGQHFDVIPGDAEYIGRLICESVVFPADIEPLRNIAGIISISKLPPFPTPPVFVEVNIFTRNAVFDEVGVDLGENTNIGTISSNSGTATVAEVTSENEVSDATVDETTKDGEADRAQLFAEVMLKQENPNRFHSIRASNNALRDLISKEAPVLLALHIDAVEKKKKRRLMPLLVYTVFVFIVVIGLLLVIVAVI